MRSHLMARRGRNTFRDRTKAASKGQIWRPVAQCRQPPEPSVRGRPPSRRGFIEARRERAKAASNCASFEPAGAHFLTRPLQEDGEFHEIVDRNVVHHHGMVDRRRPTKNNGNVGFLIGAGLFDISATALKAAINGSIFAEPAVAFVITIALPRASTFALPTAHATIA